jgi:hypothetical protein
MSELGSQTAICLLSLTTQYYFDERGSVIPMLELAHFSAVAISHFSCGAVCWRTINGHVAIRTTIANLAHASYRVPYYPEALLLPTEDTTSASRIQAGSFIADPREIASGTDVLLSSPEIGNVSPCSIYRDTFIENKALSPRFDCVAPITEVPPCCSLMFAAILHFTSSYTTSQASKPCIARVHNRAAYQTRCVIPFLSSYQEAISTLSTFSTSSLLSSSQSHHC